jgi:hypothetical protein
MKLSHALLPAGAALCLVLSLISRRASTNRAFAPDELTGGECAGAACAGAETPLSLLAPTPLAMHSGDTFVLRGSVRTSYDGSVFDAVTRSATEHDGAGQPETVTRESGLFALGAGGLEVVEQHPEQHTYRVMANSGSAPACALLGVSTPCLLPRTAELAHERLLPQDEFVRTLNGSVSAAIPATPLAPPSAVRALSNAFLGGSALLFTLFGLLVVRARRASPIGLVRAAARAAHRHCAQGDPTLAPLRAQIAPLLARARDLERARRACEAKLATVDRESLERKRAEWKAANGTATADALAWIGAECTEADRLQADRDASVAGLVRIASALRVLALCARKHRGVRARIATSDPVDAMGIELELRDAAIAEAEQLTARS